ncbi:hypothetical protein [Sphingobium sp. CR28]|uniref:hypothetical protein n=1 Tax=Sphingobium sp. CR28 TaxID=3400272 RepID=UPI003FED4C69
MRGDSVRDETAATSTRDIALRSVAQIEAAYGRSASETAALGRWLISALAAMNGGGLLITVLVRNEIDPVAARLAVAIFGAGLLAAFLGACLRAAAALWLSASLRGASATWMGAATGGGIDEEALASVRRVRGRARLSRLLVALIGLVSTLLLLGGGTVLWREFIAPAFSPQAAVQPAEVDIEAANAAMPDQSNVNVVTMIAEDRPTPPVQTSATPLASTTAAASAPVKAEPVQKASPAPAPKVAVAPKSAPAKPAPRQQAQPTPQTPARPKPTPTPMPTPRLPYASPPASDGAVSSAASSPADSPASQ